MAKEPVLSIVLPSYQEEENLRILLPRLSSALEMLPVSAEILVIDTNKPMDDTSLVCKKFNVRYIPRDADNSFGSAVRTGIYKASGDYVLFMDADGSHPPEFISNLFEFAESNDVVIASRYIPNGDTENSFFLILMSRVLNWTFSFILGLPCKDVSNSFKIYRASQLKALKLKCNNFDIIEEILFKLKKNNPNIKFKEIPFVFRKRMHGVTKRNLLAFILTYLVTILKLRFRP